MNAYDIHMSYNLFSKNIENDSVYVFLVNKAEIRRLKSEHDFYYRIPLILHRD